MRSDGYCRSCHAPTRMVIYAANGTELEIDPAAIRDGNVWVVGTRDGKPLVEMALHPDGVPSSEPFRYTPHAVTCTADQWRRGVRRD